MKLITEFHKKPIEIIAAISLILIGVGLAAFSSVPAMQGLGSAMAALGGALLSDVANDVNSREKAIALLGDHLKVISGNLANAVTNISRNIQSYQSNTLKSETAIAQIAEHVSSLYVAIRDLQGLVGAPPDFGALETTLEACEEMGKLENFISRTGQVGEAPKGDLEDLRNQLDAVRLQLITTKKELGGIEVVRVDEKVECPYCGCENIVKLGSNPDASAIPKCVECNRKFHVHRDKDKKAYSKQWGSSYVQTQMSVICPDCKDMIPLRFNSKKDHEERFCLRCTSLIRISADGHSESLKKDSPIRATSNGTIGMLTCPLCKLEWPKLWENESSIRAVCSKCHKVLEVTK